MKSKFITKKAPLLLASVIMATVLAACSENETNNSVEVKETSANESGMPIVNETMKVSAFAGKFFAEQDFNDLTLFNEYEKMTNIDVEWETVQHGVLTEKKNLKIASGDLPDFFMASSFTATDLTKYGSQGVFVPLNPYLEKYAPNFMAILEKYPKFKQGVTMPDGNIYGFPTIYDPEFDGLRGSSPWINQTWLDNLGLERPETLDELYNVLKAFKTQDPNKNGIADEQGWSASSILGVMNRLYGPFNIYNQGTMNTHLDMAEGSDEFRFVPATDEFKALLEYTHKLYKDGLIHQNIFTTDYHKFVAEASKLTTGVLTIVDPEIILKSTEYEPMGVIADKDGKKKYNSMTTGLGNIGQFVITNKAKDPAALVRWMDYFYSDEGTKMFFMGFEGLTYEEKDDGTVDYLEHMKTDPNKNLDLYVSEHLMWPGGVYPGIVRYDYFKGGESSDNSRINAEEVKKYRIPDDKIIPKVNYTLDENDQITTILADVNTYVDEMIAKFVTGNVGFNQWDTYKQNLEKMGVDTYVEITQKAYERGLQK
mgnify:FL=1